MHTGNHLMFLLVLIAAVIILSLGLRKSFMVVKRRAKTPNQYNFFVKLALVLDFQMFLLDKPKALPMQCRIKKVAKLSKQLFTFYADLSSEKKLSYEREFCKQGGCQICLNT